MQAVLPPELMRIAIISALTAGFVCAPRPVVMPSLPRVTQQRRVPPSGGKTTPLFGWLQPLFT